MSELANAVARRGQLQWCVGRTVDELAATRWANGTAPASHADWIDLIDERIADLSASVLAGGTVPVDDLVGLAADLQGLLETVMREAAA